MHFKCPDSYCVPWGYICDGKWDCPYGYDESHHFSCGPHRICDGMFKCKYSQICLHLGDVCDGYSDCPSKDDEFLCDIKVPPCINGCQCLNLAISCTNTHVEIIFSETPYLSYHITFCNLTTIASVFQAKQSVVVDISNNHITDICHLTYKKKSEMVLLDISFNNIVEILKNCFSNLDMLSSLALGNNYVTNLQPYTFTNLRHLLSINLANNKLTKLPNNIFVNTSKLYLFNVYGNYIIKIDISFFASFSVVMIHTNLTHICCIKPPISTCTASVPWFVSCSMLFPNRAIQICYVSLSLLIIFLNFLSLVLHFQQTNVNHSDSNVKVGESYICIICAINVGDLLCGMYLAILWSADMHYGDDFPVKELQ